MHPDFDPAVQWDSDLRTSALEAEGVVAEVLFPNDLPFKTGRVSTLPAPTPRTPVYVPPAEEPSIVVPAPSVAWLIAALKPIVSIAMTPSEGAPNEAPLKVSVGSAPA